MIVRPDADLRRTVLSDTSGPVLLTPSKAVAYWAEIGRQVNALLGNPTHSFFIAWVNASLERRKRYGHSEQSRVYLIMEFLQRGGTPTRRPITDDTGAL